MTDLDDLKDSAFLLDMRAIPDDEKPHILELVKKVNATIVRTNEHGHKLDFIMGETDDEQTRFKRMIKFMHRHLPFLDKVPVLALGVAVISFCLTNTLKALGFDISGFSAFIQKVTHLMVNYQ